MPAVMMFDAFSALHPLPRLAWHLFVPCSSMQALRSSGAFLIKRQAGWVPKGSLMIPEPECRDLGNNSFLELRFRAKEVRQS
jgi:hypothetical protein